MIGQAPILEVTRNSRSEQGRSLPKLLESHLQYHRIEGSTEATLIHKKKQIGMFIRWLDDQGYSLNVDQITRLDVIEHLDHVRSLGRAPETIKTRFRAIRAWANWMRDWELIEKPFTEGIKTPKAPEVPKPFLSQEQFNAMLELCPPNTYLGARRSAMLHLFISSGIRRAEMCGLRLQDLNWDDEVVMVLGKGQKYRTAPFVRPYAQRVMLRYLKAREDRFHDSEPWLWLTEEGRRLQDRGIGSDIKGLMERAGVETVDICHVMRRTWAAVSVRKGIPRPYVRAVAGWSTSGMLDRYTRHMEQEEEALEAYRNFNPFSRSYES